MLREKKREDGALELELLDHGRDPFDDLREIVQKVPMDMQLRAFGELQLPTVMGGWADTNEDMLAQRLECLKSLMRTYNRVYNDRLQLCMKLMYSMIHDEELVLQRLRAAYEGLQKASSESTQNEEIRRIKAEIKQLEEKLGVGSEMPTGGDKANERTSAFR